MGGTIKLIVVYGETMNRKDILNNVKSKDINEVKWS
jgi:hypothetical protein